MMSGSKCRKGADMGAAQKPESTKFRMETGEKGGMQFGKR